MTRQHAAIYSGVASISGFTVDVIVHQLVPIPNLDFLSTWLPWTERAIFVLKWSPKNNVGLINVFLQCQQSIK